jgi:hypothetical protein
MSSFRDTPTVRLSSPTRLAISAGEVRERGTPARALTQRRPGPGRYTARGPPRVPTSKVLGLSTPTNDREALVR